MLHNGEVGGAPTLTRRRGQGHRDGHGASCRRHSTEGRSNYVSQRTRIGHESNEVGDNRPPQKTDDVDQDNICPFSNAQ